LYILWTRSNGLDISLEADKNFVSTGDSINFTVTLRNLSTSTMNLIVGDSFSGDEFHNGSFFRVHYGVNNHDSHHVVECAPMVQKNPCPDSTSHYIVGLPSNETIIYRITAWMIKLDDGIGYLFFGSDSMRNVIPFPRTNHVISLSFYRQSNEMELFQISNLWTGSIRSNPLNIFL